MHLAMSAASNSARGAERVAVNVARGLAARGHRVDFLVEENGEWLTRQMSADPVHIVGLRTGRRASVADRLVQLWVFTLHLLSSPRALPTVRPCLRLSRRPGPLQGRAALAGAASLPAAGEAARRAVVPNYPNTVLLLTAQIDRGGTRFVVSVRNHMSSAAAHNELSWVRSVPRLMRRLFGFADSRRRPVARRRRRRGGDHRHGPRTHCRHLQPRLPAGTGQHGRGPGRSSVAGRRQRADRHGLRKIQASRNISRRCCGPRRRSGRSARRA